MRIRKLRIEQLIRKSISNILIYQMNIKFENNIKPTVSRVSLSNDLGMATIFIQKNKEEQENMIIIKKLNQNSNFIKKILSKEAYLKYVPKIKFEIDEELEFLTQLNDYINESKK